MKNLTVVIKTFIRYGVCRSTIKAFRAISPDLDIMVIDDTPMNLRQHLEGVNHVQTPEDIGLCAGRNLGFEMAETPFVIYTDDDSPPVGVTTDGLKRVVGWLQEGRADLIGWQAWCLTREANGQIVLDRKRVGEFTPCDVTQNAFVATREFLVGNPYPEEIKINGEHFTWFTLLKERGARVAASDLLKFKNLRTKNPAYEKWRRRSYRKVAKRLTGCTDAKWVNKLGREKSE